MATEFTVGAGRWFNPAKWTVGVPGSNDDAVIRTGGAALLTTVATSTDPGDPAASVGSLTLNVSSNLELDAFAALSVARDVINHGSISLDPGPYGWQGASLLIGGKLSNTGRVSVVNGGNGGTLDAPIVTRVAASSVVNGATGRIDVVGSSTPGNQAALLVGSAAGFGTTGVVTGVVTVSGEGLIQFASGQITTIASGAVLSLTGPHAYVADAGSTSSNSALVGLNRVGGDLGLFNQVSVTTSGALFNTGHIALDAGPYG